MILSHESECTSLSLADCCHYPSLLSNHEEADTKVIAHSLQALQVRPLIKCINAMSTCYNLYSNVI